MPDWSTISQSGAGKKSQRQYRQVSPISFTGFSGGLNCSVPPHQIERNECADLVNFRIVRGGQAVTRPPIVAHTDAVFNSGAHVHDAVYCSISGTHYELFIDSEGELYYNNSGTPTSIGSVSGSPHRSLLPYNSVCLLLDGSYIKYIDSVTEIKIAYDDGTGPSGYQYNNLSDSISSSYIVVGNGTNTRAAAKFTSQSWDAGFTIPPTTVTFNLQRVGDGFFGTDNVDLVVRLRAVSDDSILASKVLVSAPIATNLAATASEYEVTFSSTDITTQMSPSTAYYLSIEYSNGNVSNYIALNCGLVVSGGVGYHYASSTWVANTTFNPICGIRPGRPPKASYGVIHNQRPFVAGDPSNLGIIHFGNITHLDWSTPDGGGYVGAVDSGANNFPVGALASIYSELYVFGKEKQPYICKLTGSSPTDYSLPDVFQRSWSEHHLVAATPNDIWFASSNSLSNLSGVQEFGDVRVSPFASPVSNRFDLYWDSDASMLEYFPDTGQLLLSFPNYHRVLVCHTSCPTRVKGSIRYPWSEYEFTKDLLSDPSLYKWTESGSGTNEYYIELVAGGDPSILEPDSIILSGSVISPGTVGSLSDHSWGYGDNDTLGYSTVYIRDDSGNPSSTGVEIRSCIIPTMLKYVNGKMLVGCSDGLVYKFDRSEYKEHTSIQIRYDLRTPYIYPHIDAVVMERLDATFGGLTGGKFDVSIYTDNKSAYSSTFTFYLPVDDSLTVDSMVMDVEDAYFLVDTEYYLIQEWVEISAYSFQIRVHNLSLSGNAIVINSMDAYIRPLNM